MSRSSKADGAGLSGSLPLAAAASDNALDNALESAVPLAARMRPRTLQEFVGQQHLLGPDHPLVSWWLRGRLHSMVLWGPPGCGKTSLARLLADCCDYHWQSLSAVLGGVKEIRAAVELAAFERQRGRPTALFIDEIHRFNKAQQDALLPHVESGDLTLIGATTENPSFELNNALLSRARVYVLKPLGSEALNRLLQRALAQFPDRSIDSAALEQLVELADGDARMALNLLDVALQLGIQTVTVEHVRSASGSRYRRFDKQGDTFYDQISALHKAVRGSAPDAALYWFMRMIDGGCDPAYLARRLTRIASEDVGLADPRALPLCLDAWQAFERMGAPEGELALAQAVLYLASCPKSNAAYQAFNAARELVQTSASSPVPERLRNAPTGLAKELGHGQGYRYAHDEEQAYAAGERYWPDAMSDHSLYTPTDFGLERKIGERLRRLRRLDEQAPQPLAGRPGDSRS